MQEFLHTKAMLTPGMAGAATTMITGTLVTMFGVPGNWTGLIVSFFLGLLALADKSIPILHRIFFYVFNSLTIFTVAMGFNQAGIVATGQQQQVKYEYRSISPEASPPFFHNWF